MISAIVAMDLNRAIGSGNQLPWHMPNDFKFFKDTTKGHPCIMGRKTCETLGKPLPNRTNIVITRQVGFSKEGFTVVHTLDEALAIAKKSAGAEEIFIIGGSEIYALGLSVTNRIYLTEIHTKVPKADAWFPKFESEQWKVTSRKACQADDKNPFDYVFLVYDRS